MADQTQFEYQVLSDLGPAAEAIAQAATAIATKRAAAIAELSGGAVETTPEQQAAITDAASTELFDGLRERLRDVVNVYIVNIRGA